MNLLPFRDNIFWRVGLPSGMNFFGADLIRWVICGAMIAVPYALLGQGLSARQKLTKRTYRYAD